MSKAKLNNNMGNEPELKGLLKHRFEEMELEPDIDLWPAIEEKIQKEPKLWLNWKAYTAVAACLVVLISVWLFSRKTNELKAPIAETSQQVEAPIISQDNYKREMASLERQRTSPSDSKNSSPEKNQKARIEKMQPYLPGPRAGQSLTLPIVEEQIIAAASINEKKKDKEKKIESLRAEKVEKADLISISPTKVKVDPIKIEPKENSRQLAVRKVSENTTEINLNNIKKLNKLNGDDIKGVVMMAAQKINEKTELLDIPVKVEEKQTQYGKKRTYQVQFLNVSFTRITYRPEKTSKQL